MKVAIIAAAIALAAPAIPRAQRLAYAKILSADQDPIALVAIIQHESRWKARARSKDGEDFGLGQLRARYLGVCSRDRDPVHHPSRRCSALKRKLLIATDNLHLMVHIVQEWRRACRTNEATVWISGYAQGKSCGPPGRAVREILAIDRSLRVRLHLLPSP